MMKTARSSLTKRQRPAGLAPMVALCLPIILGVVSFAIDGGILLQERRHAQAVADSAALSAATDLYKNWSTNQGHDSTSGSANTSAVTTASDNGYTSTSSTVTVRISPSQPQVSDSVITDSSGNLKPGYVEVTVQYNQSRFFSKIWSSGTMPVYARSVVRGVQSAASGVSILLLDPSGQKALQMSGGANVKTGGKIIVDSSNSDAVDGSGGANINGTEIDITGNYQMSGGASFTGTVKTGQTATADPLASLPAPSTTGMAVQSSSKENISGGTTTLYPGRYIGGINVSGGATVNLQPGIYYLDGGGLNLSGGSTMSGSGVMFYNNALSNGDQINLSGGTGLTLSPPTTGTYAGVTFFQNRTSNAQAQFSGGSNQNMTGTFYFPDASINISGGTSTDVIGSEYIAYDMQISGGGTLNVPAGSSAGTGSPDIRLIE